MTRRAYVFDIDGTLANAEHRLHHIQKTPADWPAFFDACDPDKPIPHMIDLFKVIWNNGDAVLFCTGRSDDTLEKTVNWLNAHLLPPGQSFMSEDLYMRAAGDKRADTIVKSELMDQIIAQGWTPIMVFEDRASVVTMWRERGIPCCQVAPGDF